MKCFFKLILTFVLVLSGMGEGAWSAPTKETVLTKDNMVVLDGPVTDQSVSKVIHEARKLDSSLKGGLPIILVLKTPGGSIQAGMDLIEALKAFNRPIHTLTLFAASMGFQIAQHLGDREIVSYGTLMSHKARGGMEGEFGDGLSQFDSRYAFWLRRIKLLDEQTVKRTNGKQTLKSYRAAYENELWLNGEESVEQGYADRVVTVRCDQSLNGLRVQEYNFLGVTFSVKLSECPLITTPVGAEAFVHTNVGAMLLSDFLRKGGVMGRECPSQESRFSFVREEYGPQPPQVLCALDKDLTVDKIKEKEVQVLSEFSLNKLREKVIVKP